jgi:hypothetical protein
MVSEAAAKFTLAHKRLTPMDMLDFYAGANADTLAQRHADGPGTVIQTNPVNLQDRASVLAMANQVLQQKLGRDATDAEVNTFFNTINKEIQANPGTTVTTTDAKGNKTQVNHPGYGPDDIQQMLIQTAENNPEFAAKQGATTYFNAAMQALQPIGGTGA